MRRRRLPEPFVIFVDECLGRDVVPRALRSALQKGEKLLLLDQGILDEEWLPRAGKEGWLCLSKDRRLTTTPHQLSAILQCGVGLFTVGDATGAEQANRIVDALPTMRRVARVTAVAFIARVEPDGIVRVKYAEGAQLSAPRLVKPKAKHRGGE